MNTTVPFPAPRGWRGAALVAVMALAATACGRDPAPAGEAPAPAGPRLDFPAKHPIDVELELRAPEDGGRAVPIAGAWRGQVLFDGGAEPVSCAVIRAGGELGPGVTHQAQLRCVSAVALPDDGRRGFLLLEDGAGIGSGTVLP